jgi:hypothetical protein
MTANKYDLTGKKIDMVTVVERASTTKTGSIIWLCQCDCGKKFEITSSSFNRKKFKSCGCVTLNNKPSPRRLDLIGQKFNRLTVIEFDGLNQNKKTKWLCRCECGNITTVVGSQIKNGNTLSCGCYQRESATKAGKKNLRDLTGNRFGRLTVTSKKESKKRKVYWNCICDCGQSTAAHSQDLRSGKRKSCGCIFEEFVGKNHPNWKGGRRVEITGYVTLSGYQSHPNSSKSGSIAEHRLVMSQMLDRPLKKGESVHHKNGVRDDNRPENLELWVKYQPSGQKVADRIIDAIDLLKTYAPDLINRKNLDE